MKEPEKEGQMESLMVKIWKANFKFKKNKEGEILVNCKTDDGGRNMKKENVQIAWKSLGL